MMKKQFMYIVLVLAMMNSPVSFALTPLMLEDIETVLPNAKSREDIDKVVQIRKNPKPIQAYEFTIDLLQIPKDLTLKSVILHYINDNSCRYKLDSLGVIGDYRPHYGHTLTGKHIQQLSKHQFRVRLYRDYLMTDDYFKTGRLCTWHIGEMELRFENKGNLNQKQYVARINSPIYADNLISHYDDPVDLVKIEMVGVKQF